MNFRRWATRVLLFAVFVLTMSMVSRVLPTKEEAQAYILSKGAWGSVFFVLLFAVGNPCFLPSIVLFITAGVVWPVAQAWALSFCGALTASTVGFIMGKYVVGVCAAEKHFPAMFFEYNDKLKDHPVLAVALSRFIFFLSPPVHWFYGVSDVDFPRYLLGTALGILPSLTLWICVGVRLIMTQNWTVLVGIGIGYVLVKMVIIYSLHKKFWKKAAAEEPTETSPLTYITTL